MTSVNPVPTPRRLWGGWAGPLLLALFLLAVGAMLLGFFYYPGLARQHGRQIAFQEVMFGPKLEQPIAFSHRLHVTDKQIDCAYCHPNGERSPHPGLPTAEKCLGCHNHIIPQHQEILKLKQFAADGTSVPWVRVYYSPDHVYFPHFRHLKKEVRCQECHGEVEKTDRLSQVTFYMGFCVQCHQERQAPMTCSACHQ